MLRKTVCCRSYYYDSETGFYSTATRYYDPAVGRFINADGYASTGQGVGGNNMYSYCGNNPVTNTDPSGEFFVAALITAVIVAAATVKGSSRPIKREPYNSADEAAEAFAEYVYGASHFIRHEYGATIYARTDQGITTYNYTDPYAGGVHHIVVNTDVPEGTTVVAFAHTHPTLSGFSDADIKISRNSGYDSYVVGPNLELKHFNPSIPSITIVGGYGHTISPIPLNTLQKKMLVTAFKASWDSHFENNCCDGVGWPAE